MYDLLIARLQKQCIKHVHTIICVYVLCSYTNGSPTGSVNANEMVYHQTGY